MTLDGWAGPDRVLWEARRAAFAPGEFVGQEGFAGAGEIRWLAERSGIGPGVSVLDVCCGMGGPGLFIARELGCDYLGVDADARAVRRACQRAAEERVGARFELMTVPPLPAGTFDVVLLLETLLAFRAKAALFRVVSSALPTGGRFALTVEEGLPLSADERLAMPDSDTVWLTPFPELEVHLERAGLEVREVVDRTDAHQEVVDALVQGYVGAASELVDGAGVGVVDGLITGHRLWSSWLAGGRVRKLAVVAEKVSE